MEVTGKDVLKRSLQVEVLRLGCGFGCREVMMMKKISRMTPSFWLMWLNNWQFHHINAGNAGNGPGFEE